MKLADETDLHRPGEVASLYVLGLLEGTEKAAFERHLTTCASCTAEVRSAGVLEIALAAATPQVAAPMGLRERILQQAATTVPEIRVFRGSEAVWDPTPFAGILQRVLSYDRESGRRVTMVRIEAGAQYPAHEHAGEEHCYVIEGDLQFEDHALQAGDYEIADKASRHSAITSRGGCTALIVHHRRDKFLRT